MKVEVPETGSLASAVLIIDTALFDVGSVKRACYKFADLADFSLSQGSDGLHILISTPISSSVSIDLQGELIPRLRQEILDQDLRKTIADETKDIRTLILAEAFKNTRFIE